MDAIAEKAREVGRHLAGSDEYRALRRANERIADDRAAVERLNRLQALEESFQRQIQRGTEPPQEEQEEYERLVGEIQAMSAYQAVAAAQADFDRLMMRVQEQIAKGIEAGEQSRIILSP